MLSYEALELYEVFKARYIRSGYLYSGMIPLNAPQIAKHPTSTLYELVDAGILEKRDCAASAYQLSVSERRKLIEMYDLSIVWDRADTGAAFYPNRYDGEVTRVNKAVAMLHEEKVPLSSQIHSAADRSGETQKADAPAKDPAR